MKISLICKWSLWILQFYNKAWVDTGVLIFLMFSFFIFPTICEYETLSMWCYFQYIFWHIYRKCQDYVYVIWEYYSTMWKIEHYLRHENKVNEGLSYCKALRYIWNNNNNKKEQKVVFLHVKLTNLLSFETRFKFRAYQLKKIISNGLWGRLDIKMPSFLYWDGT